MTPGAMQRPGDEVPSFAEAQRLLLRLATLARPFWSRMLRGVWLGVVLGFAGMLTPWISKWLIDEAYPRQDIGLMHVLVAGGLGLGLANALLRGIRLFYTQAVGAHLESVAELMYFNHMQHLGPAFFERRRVGEVLSRFNDLKASLGILSTLLETVLMRGSYLILVPPLLAFLNWRLALLALVTTPLVLAVSACAGQPIRRRWQASAEAYSDVWAMRMEGLSHVRTIQGLAAEGVLYERLRDRTQAALGLRLSAVRLSTLLDGCNDILRAGGAAAMTWYAWTLILRGSLTLGGYFAFMAYLEYVTGPMEYMASFISRFQQWAVSLGRTFEYLDEVPRPDWGAVESGVPEGDAPRLTGGVQLQNVSFQYETERRVLSDLSLAVKASTVVTLVGPSGSGKSTVLKLVAGFEAPDAGTIHYEGAPWGVGHAALRSQVTVVWPESALFHGTIRENLVLGAPNATAEEVTKAVQACRLEDLLRDLPDGYDGTVAEWGATLSSGQRARVALARALLRATPLLILDEATSSVDVDTELAILSDLFRAARAHGRTILFATHRMSAAVLADYTYVLHEGRVSAEGTHLELLELSDFYRRMSEGIESAEAIKHQQGAGFSVRQAVSTEWQ